MAKIAIVDDAKFMRLVLRRILTQAGHEIVAEGQTGVDAVEIWARDKPECMTLDIVMPKQNGIEAVKQIMTFDPSARIIMVTALGQEAFVLEAIKAGAREFIIKPFRNEEIVKAVAKTINS
jgi:two-component system, chemotaxis family, chemotaxis protein CheY